MDVLMSNFKIRIQIERRVVYRREECEELV